jgi:hypothetical protein
VLIEWPSPWDRKAPYDETVRELLPAVRSLESAGIRTLLIRQEETQRTGPYRVFQVDTTLAELRGSDCASVADVEDALDRMRAGERLERADGAIALVCTHGRHDQCCAIDGLAVFRALSNAPMPVWRSSHFGGDRFAGNMLIFPEGLYFGWVEPGRANDILADYLDSRITLDFFRGRTTLPFAAQAAECLLRERLDLPGIRALVLLDDSVRPGSSEYIFETENQERWLVTVAQEQAGRGRVTCHASRERSTTKFVAVAIERLEQTRSKGAGAT